MFANCRSFMVSLSVPVGPAVHALSFNLPFVVTLPLCCFPSDFLSTFQFTHSLSSCISSAISSAKISPSMTTLLGLVSSAWFSSSLTHFFLSLPLFVAVPSLVLNHFKQTDFSLCLTGPIAGVAGAPDFPVLPVVEPTVAVARSSAPAESSGRRPWAAVSGQFCMCCSQEL